ncbi:MAG: hypothetical protein KJ607_04630 [Bacteroidetes bacterium]|nr:hypothetical protein [Bacteroidota bacterium]
MYRIILLLLLTCAFNLNINGLYAQPSGKEKTTDYQLDFSVNSMSPGLYNFADSAGFNGSFTFVFFAPELYNFIFGASYNRSVISKQQLKYDMRSSYMNMVYRLTTASLPLLFRISYGKRLRGFIESGFTFEWIQNCTSSGFYVEDSVAIPVSGKPGGLCSYDISVGGNLGMIIPVKKIGIVMSAGYHYGTLDLLEEYYGELHNNYWKATIGICFRRASKPANF